MDALLCDMKIDLANGEALRINSGADWVVARADGEAWETPVVHGPANAAPWKRWLTLSRPEDLLITRPPIAPSNWF